MNSSNNWEKLSKGTTFRSIEHQSHPEDSFSKTITISPRQKSIYSCSCLTFTFVFAIVFSFLVARTYYEFVPLPAAEKQPNAVPTQDVSVALLDSLRAILENDYRMMRIDPVGLPDYALAYHGAKIFDHSETDLRGAKFRGPFKLKMFYEPREPEIVIEKSTEAVMPGNCWPFKGSVGYVTIELPQVINVSAISYEHAPSNLIPPDQLRSAPKLIQLWAGLKSDVKEFLGELSYIVPNYGPTIHKLQQPSPAKYVKFSVLENHGDPEYTCLYRIRIYGVPL